MKARCFDAKKYIFIDDNHSCNINYSERTTTDTPLHLHDFYELELVLDGSGSTTINGVDYAASKGVVFLITPSDVHCYKSSEGLKIANLSFTPDAIEYSILLEILYPMRYIVGKSNDEHLNSLTFYCKQASQISKSNSQFADKYVSLLLTCLLIELNNMENKSLEKYDDKMSQINCLPVQQALWFINSHFKEDITLEILSQHIGIPPSSLGKKFSRYYGINFKEYLINTRLQYAKSLIMNTNESLTEIAYYSGFNSLSYFHKTFINKFGYSPKSLRKRDK